MRRIYDTLRYLGEKGTVNISFYKTDVFSIPKAEYIMFENMQPQLMKASPWQTLRNLHNRGIVYYQATGTFRSKPLGTRSLWRLREILAAISMFMPQQRRRRRARSTRRCVVEMRVAPTDKKD
jgi:sugar-specific transcriptional regulator TrmB